MSHHPTPSSPSISPSLAHSVENSPWFKLDNDTPTDDTPDDTPTDDAPDTTPDTQPSSSQKPKPHRTTRKAYSSLFKYEVILHSDAYSVKETCKKYTLRPSTAYEWIKEREKIRLSAIEESNNNKKIMRRGSGRKAQYPEVEKKLADWIKSRMDSDRLDSEFLFIGNAVTKADIKKKMEELVQEHELLQQTMQFHPEQGDSLADKQKAAFKASYTWMEGFLRRHHFRY